MYTLTFSGVAGPEADIAKVRLYLSDADPIEAGIAPNDPFDIVAHWPTSGPLSVAYAFVDAAGNESARHVQMVTVPDYAAPAAPVEDLQLVGVVWAP